jgi:signal transduction histidine kinase
MQAPLTGSTLDSEMTRERVFHRDIPVITAVVVAAVLVLVTSQQVVDDASREIDALALGLCAVTGLSLAFRRSHPLAQFVAAMSATIAYAALDYPGGPIFVVAFASALAMVAERRSLMPAAFAGGALLLAVQFTVYGWAWHLFGFAAIWFVGTALFGEAMRLRREQQRITQARAEFAQRTREQEARRRVAEERLRIARDVHDVVGHSLATIALQAGVAEHLLDGREPTARESMATIRRVSKEALAEVSAMLGVLRADTGAERAPMPDLAQVSRLVEDMRAAGLDVDLELEQKQVPEVVGGAAYRIVQESLTNVVRHAGPQASARVCVAARNGVVEIEITDDGNGAPPGTDEGNGLIGMRERAAALGGSFSASGTPGGGFVVRALLPTP